MQEMSRRLGANISKSELENLRAHVKSLQEEARRLHLSNNEMAVSLKSSSQAAAPQPDP